MTDKQLEKILANMAWDTYKALETCIYLLSEKILDVPKVLRDLYYEIEIWLIK